MGWSTSRPTRASGRSASSVRLGLERARVVMVATAIGLLAVAWLSTLLGAGLAGSDASTEPDLVAPAIGSVALLAGVAMSLRGEAIWSWRGWHVQALGVAILAVGWLVAAS